jgi:hypothetical protein
MKMQYAFLMNGDICACTNKMDAPPCMEDQCNKICIGDPDSVCGGTHAASVYATGAASKSRVGHAELEIGVKKPTVLLVHTSGRVKGASRDMQWAKLSTLLNGKKGQAAGYYNYGRMKGESVSNLDMYPVMEGSQP